MFNVERFVKVSSLEEAYELNQERTNVVLGGFMWLKMANRNIKSAIDLSNLGLDGIEETPEEFRIGAMCSLRTLELHEGLDRAFNGFLREAVHHIVGVQFRNGATVGGSIFGRFGFSDVSTALLALDSWVELFKGGLVPLDEFMKMKMDNDILVRIIIRKDGRRPLYQTMRITKTDFPVLAVAMSKSDKGLAVSMGARPTKASLFQVPAEKLAHLHSKDDLTALIEEICQGFSFGQDMRGSAAYRESLAKVFVKRGLTQLMEAEATL